jgi:hypothetical protein
LAKNISQPFFDKRADFFERLTRIKHGHAPRFFFRHRQISFSDPAVEAQGLSFDPVMPAAAFESFRNIDIQNEGKIRLERATDQRLTCSIAASGILRPKP